MMNNVENQITSKIFMLISALLIPAKILASDVVSQYGVGAESTTRFSINQKQKKDPISPVLQIDIEYQDTSENYASPHHSFNTGMNNKLSNTSNEIKTRMGYHFEHLIPEVSFNYSPDSYGFGKYYNYGLGIALPVKDIFSLETHYGWNLFDKKPVKGGNNNYQDWSIGVSTSYKGVKLKVDYIDVNISEKSEECGKPFPCEGKAVFSIIKNF